jgi:NADPH:quinone reductase-like Zn-dependent oxidoreductase
VRTPESMQVVRFDHFGGPDVLHVELVPVPEPAANELLIQVAAAGVNPVDFKIRAGKYPVVKESMLPYVPGRDVVGTVVRSGGSVDRFEEGQQIFAMPGIERGSYAQYVIVKEHEAAPKPTALDIPSAGSVPLAALTAWQGLFKHGGLESGQQVLIHGGSGGVGHFAIQLAKAKGARVATTVSSQHIEFARRLGADQVIDYKAHRFEDAVRQVDMVFDLIGGETQERSWAVLREGGVLVSTLTEPSQEQAAKHGVRGLRYTAKESGEDLAQIGRLIDAGKVRPVIARIFELSEAAAAQQFLEREHPAGKVTLLVH